MWQRQEWKRASDDGQADPGKEHTCGTQKYSTIKANPLRFAPLGILPYLPPYRPRMPPQDVLQAFRECHTCLRKLDLASHHLRTVTCRSRMSGVWKSEGSGASDSEDLQDIYRSHAKTSRTVCNPSGRVRHSAVKRRTERFCKPVCIIPCVPRYGAPQHLKVCHPGDWSGGSGIPKGAVQYAKHLIV